MRAMHPLRAPGRRTLAPALVALLALGACDNPACVFGPGNCQVDPGTDGLLGGEASIPVDGAWIRDSAPLIEAVFPVGQTVHPESPIALRFSETMDLATLQGAFRVVNSGELGSLPLVTTSLLVADGRLLLLFPATAMPDGGEIQIIFQDQNGARDLTGEPLAVEADAVVGSFSVAAEPPTEPRLVTTWPPDGVADASSRTDIVAVFDRRMKTAAFAGAGWQVTVDGAVTVPDPAPSPVNLSPISGVPVPDTRVWRYRRVDESGNILPYLKEAQVELLLSPAGAPLLSQDDEPLDQTTISFSIPSFAAPLELVLASLPTDAIGIANLTAGDARELRLSVDLDGAAAGDQISIFAFGTSLAVEPEFAAVRSDFVLPSVADPLIVTLAQTPLVLTAEPPAAIFADGDLYLAVRQRRGNIITPIRVIDGDLQLPGTQPVVLDTVRPTLTELTLPGGGADQFLSDLRDLTLTGTASEEVRAVNVTVFGYPDPKSELSNVPSEGDPFAPVVGARSNGLFIAAPVALGLVDPQPTTRGAAHPLDVPRLDYSFRIFDRALNSNGPEIVGTYRQYGALGGTPLDLDDPIFDPEDPLFDPGSVLVTVEVVDRRTLVPIVGAAVVSARYAGDDLPPEDVQWTSTDANGQATFPHLGLDTVLTVDAPGFDLFTWHGVATDWVGVTLRPVPQPLAATVGTVVAGSAAAQDLLPDSDLLFFDSRRPEGATLAFQEMGCTVDPFTGLNPLCTFGPEPIRARRLGAVTGLLGDFATADSRLPIAEVLKGFDLVLPVAAVAPGSSSATDLSIDKVLASLDGVELDDLPTALSTDLTFGAVDNVVGAALDEQNLFDDPTFVGVPTVVVEARLPGIDRPVVVGPGRSFPIPGGTLMAPGALAFGCEGIYGGELEERLEALGGFEERLHLSVTVRDVDGNRATSRLRFAEFPLPMGPTEDLRPPLVSILLEPPEAAVLPAGSFELTYNDCLTTLYRVVYDVDGLNHLRLVDSQGRSWDLYRPDQTTPGAGSNDEADDPRTILALTALDAGLTAPGLGLTPGPIQATVGLHAWKDDDVDPLEGFSAERFLWSEIPLQSLLDSLSRGYSFTLSAAPAGP
jgi:hypothetical protein